MLSQTYRCIPTDPEIEFEFLRTEAGLTDSVLDSSLLSRLLFREGDGGSNDVDAFEQLTERLREIFFGTVEAPARPVVLGTPKKLQDRDHR